VSDLQQGKAWQHESKIPSVAFSKRLEALEKVAHPPAAQVEIERLRCDVDRIIAILTKQGLWGELW